METSQTSIEGIPENPLVPRKKATIIKRKRRMSPGLHRIVLKKNMIAKLTKKIQWGGLTACSGDPEEQIPVIFLIKILMANKVQFSYSLM